ncbi:MAG: glycosyltransferase [Verrucomicrobiota bacterium]|nr:glycosyltransferase [Verrucomicrobiota bacterium]
MKAVHQFVAGFRDGDAISNEARSIRNILRAWGHASEIFSEASRIPRELCGEARDISGCVPAIRPDDVVILHLSIGSIVNEVFASLSCRKVIIYHNITPARWFVGLHPQTARDLEQGRRQLKALAGTAEINLAVSPFNARELQEVGYPNARVFPLLVDFSRLAAPPDRRTLREFGGGVNVLFVGRCAPNKKIEDLLEAFRCFQHTVEPASRLIHAGSAAGAERYAFILAARAHELGLQNVHFAGAIRQHVLNAFYRAAHIFLCMSEHEGFCIPIIESMACGVPVMAYAAAAVPDTMDGAGILFREKNYELIAEMMGRVVHDAAFRAAVIRGQNERIARYRRRDPAADLRRELAPLLDEQRSESGRMQP